MKGTRLAFPLLFSSILTSILFFLAVIKIRTGLEELLTLSNIFSVVAMMITLVTTPDIIRSVFKHSSKWYNSSGSITFMLLIILTISGFYIESDLFHALVRSLLVIIASTSVLYVVFSKKFEKDVFYIPALMVLFIFLIVYVYAEGYISILFFEQVILGLAHRDTLYHLSISEIFSTMKLASTGLHGAETINYHWGSHLLYSSLAKVLGFSSMQFYNFASPLIFVPLMIKYTIQLIDALSIRLGQKEVNPYLLCIVIPLLFSFGILTGSFIIGSMGFATLLVLMYSVIIIDYFDDKSISKLPFLLFTLLFFIAILFAKISAIFVFAPAMLYALIKLSKSKKVVLGGIVIVSIIAILTFNYVYPFELSETGLELTLSLKPLVFDLLTRIQSVFTGALNPVLNLLPFIIAIVYFFSTSSAPIFKSISSRFKDNSSILVETLIVMNVLAILPGIILDLKPVDIYYFRFIHIFLSICLLLVYLNSFIDKLTHKNGMLVSLVIILIILPFSNASGGYNLYFGSRGIKDIREQFANKTLDQRNLEDLLIVLSQKKEFLCSKKTAVYIPNDQSWYFSSQIYRSLGSNFVVQAFSGCIMIGGVTESDISHSRNHYSFGYYNDLPDLPIHNIEEAKKAALNRGFEVLIVFSRKGSELHSEIVQLL